MNDVINKANIGTLIDAIVDPPQVAGNHAALRLRLLAASIGLARHQCSFIENSNCFEHDKTTRGYTVES
jgi:CRISPR-associated protein Cst2